jgi:hypothetical protein
VWQNSCDPRQYLLCKVERSFLQKYYPVGCCSVWAEWTVAIGSLLTVSRWCFILCIPRAAFMEDHICLEDGIYQFVSFGMNALKLCLKFPSFFGMSVYLFIYLFCVAHVILVLITVGLLLAHPKWYIWLTRSRRRHIRWSRRIVFCWADIDWFVLGKDFSIPLTGRDSIAIYYQYSKGKCWLCPSNASTFWAVWSSFQKTDNSDTDI